MTFLLGVGLKQRCTLSAAAAYTSSLSLMVHAAMTLVSLFGLYGASQVKPLALQAASGKLLSS